MKKDAPKHYLCNFEGLVEPRVIGGPFDVDIPDEVIIKALREIDEEDLLFGITLYTEDGKIHPRTWAFTNVTMDPLIEKAEETETECDDCASGGPDNCNGCMD